MIGMLIWDRAGHGLRPVRMKEISVLHVRFLCGEVTALERTAAVARSHRLRAAGRRLLRQGVERVVLPEGSAADVLPKGLRPVSTLALRRAIAADWAGELLRLRQQPPGGARVLVTANALSGEVVRTVTELALRHRYLLLTVPFGGEELCRRLRREYGVSVLLNPTAEQMAEAAVQIAFDPVEAAGGSFLPLYDEQLPLPALLLPPSIEGSEPRTAVVRPVGARCSAARAGDGPVRGKSRRIGRFTRKSNRFPLK